MRKALLLLLLLASTGCDVAVATAVFLDRREDDEDATPTASSPRVVYSVWVKDVSDSAAEEATLVSNAGDPLAAGWTRLGEAAATAVFDATGASPSPNAVLVAAGNAGLVHFDAIELIDAFDSTTETASGPVRSGHLSAGTADFILGPPDGVTADTAAPAAAQAFAFTIFASTPGRIRVSAWLAARASGDVESVMTRGGAGDQGPTSLAAAPDGHVYVGVSIPPDGTPRDFWIWRFDASLAFVDADPVAAGVVAPGSCSVSADAGAVYVAAQINDPGVGFESRGDIRLRKYTAFPAAFTEVSVGTASQADRVEGNAVSFDATGDLIFAGGKFELVGGLNHVIEKRDGANLSTIEWSQALNTGVNRDAADTYWHAAAVSRTDGRVYTAGNLTNLASGRIEDVARQTESAGTAAWSEQLGQGNDASGEDRGLAVAVDGAGNVVTAGYFTRSGAEARNAYVAKYNASGTLSWLSATSRSGNEEILDVTVDADGTIYAVGYETVGTENAWIRKYAPSQGILWTRTVDGTGGGSDRAVAVEISGAFLIVALREQAADAEVHIRRYVK